MLRKLLLLSSFVSLALLAAIITSCGGSSSSSTACSGGPYNVVGDWQGTVSANGVNTSLVGAINSSGSAVFFDNTADVATVAPITGTCSFSATMNLYASEIDGDGSLSGTASGNVTASTISGTADINSQTGSVSLSSYSPLSGAVSVPSSDVAGEVQGQVETDFITSLTVGGTSGSITYAGTDINDCSINGTFTEEGTNNVYDVTFDVSGSSGSCSGSFTGIGFESNSDLLDADDSATGTYLYAVLNTSSAPFVLEIYPPLTGADREVREQRRGTGSLNLFGFGPAHRR
jgi:hypothetical protein